LKSYTGLLSPDVDGPVFGCFRGRGMAEKLYRAFITRC